MFTLLKYYSQLICPDTPAYLRKCICIALISQSEANDNLVEIAVKTWLGAHKHQKKQSAYKPEAGEQLNRAFSSVINDTFTSSNEEEQYYLAFFVLNLSEKLLKKGHNRMAYGLLETIERIIEEANLSPQSKFSQTHRARATQHAKAIQNPSLWQQFRMFWARICDNTPSLCEDNFSSFNEGLRLLSDSILSLKQARKEKFARFVIPTEAVASILMENAEVLSNPLKLTPNNLLDLRKMATESLTAEAHIRVFWLRMAQNARDQFLDLMEKEVKTPSLDSNICASASKGVRLTQLLCDIAVLSNPSAFLASHDPVGFIRHKMFSGYEYAQNQKLSLSFQEVLSAHQRMIH